MEFAHSSLVRPRRSKVFNLIRVLVTVDEKFECLQVYKEGKKDGLKDRFTSFLEVIDAPSAPCPLQWFEIRGTKD